MPILLLVKPKPGLLFFLILFLASPFAQSKDITAQRGFLDASGINLNESRVALSGDWLYFENQLLTPVESAWYRGSFTLFPETWNQKNKGTGSGYATYALKVLVPKDAKQLALEIPQIYSSYELWVNNKLVAVNGTVGKSEVEALPQWMPQTVSFENPGDTLSLVLQIANFQHFNGGSKDPIYLGSSDLLQHHRSLAVKGNLVESTILALLSVSFLCVYFLGVKKRIVMYFALLCLTWAVRVGFSNLYVFISLIPDFNWYAMIRIEYFTLFFTMIWAILFLCRVFPKEESKVIKYVLVGSNCLFIVITAVFPPIIFTQWISVYLLVSGLLLAYGTILVLRAWINQRTGATYLTISLLLALAIFGYDVFAYEGFFAYNPIIFSVGYVTIFSLMGIVLLIHLDIIKRHKESISKLTYKDLYKD